VVGPESTLVQVVLSRHVGSPQQLSNKAMPCSCGKRSTQNRRVPEWLWVSVIPTVSATAPSDLPVLVVPQHRGNPSGVLAGAW
jgi:hypothetical protein